ncbi:MAG TPA: hypothetical protein VFZ64_06650 [Nocardioidaceae bacterium]
MEHTSTATERSFLEELRRRRGELRGSIDALELALSAPAAMDRQRWQERVHAALVELSSDLRLHVEITEGPQGLHQELLEAAPRLSEAVRRLAVEHVQIAEQTEKLLHLAANAENLEDVTVLRDLGTDLLGTLIRHRQRGADLVYEAYEFDIGGDT